MACSGSRGYAARAGGFRRCANRQGGALMLRYTLRRLLLIFPTLLGILTINFFIVQTAPGGPVEQFIAMLEGSGSAYMERVGSAGADLPAAGMTEAAESA